MHMQTIKMVFFDALNYKNKLSIFAMSKIFELFLVKIIAYFEEKGYYSCIS